MNLLLSFALVVVSITTIQGWSAVEELNALVERQQLVIQRQKEVVDLLDAQVFDCGRALFFCTVNLREQQQGESWENQPFM